MTPKAYKMQSDPRKRVEWLVERASEIPAQTSVAIQVHHLVNQRNSSASQIAHALSTDQVLTARVLKTANSAFYGAPRRIATLTDAIVLLGMRTIRDIAMSVSCQDMLARAVPGYVIAKGELWRHSCCCGYGAQQLAKLAGFQVAEEAYIGGLLHDIGKVVISYSLTDEFVEIADLAGKQNEPFTEAEEAVLGFDHAEVGACMAEHWNLPKQLVEAIRYHHRPSEQPEPSDLTYIIHLADAFCMMLGIGLGGDGLRYKLEPGIIDRLGLDNDDIDGVMSSIIEFAASVADDDLELAGRS
jgi:putative nucleotidyltransferase with HDIG domain